MMVPFRKMILVMTTKKKHHQDKSDKDSPREGVFIGGEQYQPLKLAHIPSVVRPENGMKKPDRTAVLAAWSAFAAVLVYLITLHYSSKQFHTDERAWITADDPNIKLSPLDPFNGAPSGVAEFRFQNTGKTVALDLRIKVIGIRAARLTDSFIENVVSGNYQPKVEPGIQPMLASFGNPNTSDRRYVWPYSIPITLAPGAQTLSAFSAMVVKPGPSLDPEQEMQYTYLFGRADYRDAFGTEHWQTICYIYIGAPNDKDLFQYCPVGNRS